MNGSRTLQLVAPFAVGLWIVVTTYADSVVHPLAAVRVLVVVIVLAIVATGVWWLATRRAWVAGLGASATLLLLGSQDLARLGIGLLLIGLVIMAIHRVGRLGSGAVSADSAGRIVAIGALALLAVALVRAVATAIPIVTPIGSEPAPAMAEGARPDIYLIVVDGYPRADTLEAITGDDNGDFVAALEERGFVSASASRTSYMYTDLVLTALFHGRHLIELPALQPLIDGGGSPGVGRAALNEGRLLAGLEASGYTTLANAPAWDEPSLRSVDVILEGDGLNEFERRVLGGSLIGLAWRAVEAGLSQRLMEPWIHDGFESFSEAASRAGTEPLFAFVHIPIPHFPIVFDRDGNPAPPAFGVDHPFQSRADRTAVAEAYLEQVRYTNRRLLETLDGTELPEDAIVVIMGDHGPEFGLDWFMPQNSDLETRFATFFAARAPGIHFPDNINVGSSLAIILGSLGAADASPLSDRYFTSEAFSKLPTLTEVPDPFAPDR